MSGECIDVTPTWEGLISEALRILPHSTAEGARQIHALILQAARVADLHVAQVDAEQEQARTTLDLGLSDGGESLRLRTTGVVSD